MNIFTLIVLILLIIFISSINEIGWSYGVIFDDRFLRVVQFFGWLSVFFACLNVVIIFGWN